MRADAVNGECILTNNVLNADECNVPLTYNCKLLPDFWHTM
jgi:hypothetical protein